MCLIGFGKIGFRIFQCAFQSAAPLTRNLDFIAKALDDFADLARNLLLQRFLFRLQHRNFSALQRAIRLQFAKLAFDACCLIAQGLDRRRSQNLGQCRRFIVVLQL